MNSFNYQGADNQSLSALQLLSGSVLIQWKKKQIDGAIAVGDRFWDLLQQHSKSEIKQAMPEILETPRLVAIAANILRRPDVARLWLDRIVALDGPQASDHERSAQGFLYGTIAFEEGRYDEAYNYFKASYSFEGQDAFRGFPRWYWVFFCRREEMQTDDLLEALIGNSGEKQQQAQQQAVRAQQAQYLEQAQNMSAGARSKNSSDPQHFPAVQADSQVKSAGANQSNPRQNQLSQEKMPVQAAGMSQRNASPQDGQPFNQQQFVQGRNNVGAQPMQQFQSSQITQGGGMGQFSQAPQFAQPGQNVQFAQVQQPQYQQIPQVAQIPVSGDNQYGQPAFGQPMNNQQWQASQQWQGSGSTYAPQPQGQPSNAGYPGYTNQSPYPPQANRFQASEPVTPAPQEKSSAQDEDDRAVREEVEKSKSSAPVSSRPIDPVDALGEKGSSLYGQGDVIGAVAMWQQALSLMPKDDSRAWWFYASLADGHIQLGEYKEAWEATTEAMKAGAESSALAWYCRGVAQYQLGGRQDALGSLKMAYSLGGEELFAVGGQEYLNFLKDNDAI